MQTVLSPTGHVELYTHEQPEVTFSDSLTVELSERETLVYLDPQFLDVIDAESWIRVFASTDEPIPVGVKAVDNKIRVRLAEKPDSPLRVSLLALAIRRGFVGVRFGQVTQEVFDANEAFWANSRPTVAK